MGSTNAIDSPRNKMLCPKCWWTNYSGHHKLRRVSLFMWYRTLHFLWICFPKMQIQDSLICLILMTFLKEMRV